MHFSPGLVVLSVLVATLAGYVALDLTQRGVRAASAGARREWLLTAAATMGLGIWSMHFLGMLALDLERPVQYRLGPVAVSMVAAVLGAGIALWVVARPSARRRALLSGAGFMGAAVGAMHYSGMAGMQVEATMRWNAPLVALSLVIAYGASLFALWLVFLQRDQGPRVLRHRAPASLLLGVGVAGLHYTAMAALRFDAATHGHADPGLGAVQITWVLVIAAAVMLALLLTGSHIDQRRAALASDLAAVAAAVRAIGRSEDARASVSRAVCTLTGANLGGLLEPDGQDDLALTASHGMRREPLRIRLDQPSASGLVYRTGQPVVVSDVARSPTVVQSLAREYGVQSAAFEPVMLDDRVVGVLFCAWRERVKRLEDRAVSVAGLLANEAAFVIERADLQARLERQARTDELTGLPNRRLAFEELPRFLARARREAVPLAAAMIDIDHFKAFNDAHGHVAGDRLLGEAGSALLREVRGGDLVARYGGEEFLALFLDCSLDDAVGTAERVRAALPKAVTCSVGVALWTGWESAEELIERADAALYAAETAGRDRVTIAPEPGTARIFG